MKYLVRFLIGLVTALGLTVTFSTAVQAQTTFSAAEISSAPICQRYPAAETGYLCSCPNGSGGGSVWGSGPYTADSNICAAAVHAGVIGRDGGVVYTMRLQGQNAYSGSNRNGVSTANWGPYGTSIIVQAAEASSFLSACSTMPSGADSVTCACGADNGSNGGVWGSGPYTADSNICAAARHAGYLDSNPGNVTVLRIQGLASYVGSDWNGISTSSWGAYESSIVFNGN